MENRLRSSVFMLIAVMLLLSMACNISSPRTRKTETPTLLPPPPTRISANTATPTTKPAAPQATPTQSKIILEDDFINPAINGWSTTTTDSDFSILTRSFTNGKYLWVIRSKRGFTSTVSPKMDPVENFIASVDIKILQGDKETVRAGLIVRQVDSNNYYYIGFSEAGSVIAFKFQNGQWKNLLQNPVNTPAIVSGKENKLMVSGIGPNFTVMINNQNVLQFTEDQLKAGSIGLICEITVANLDAKIEFDNLKVERP